MLLEHTCCRWKIGRWKKQQRRKKDHYTQRSLQTSAPAVVGNKGNRRQVERKQERIKRNGKQGGKKDYQHYYSIEYAGYHIGQHVKEEKKKD